MSVSIKKIFRDLITSIKYNRLGFRTLVNLYLSSDLERLQLLDEAKAVRCKYRGLKEDGRIIEDDNKFSILTRMCD